MVATDLSWLPNVQSYYMVVTTWSSNVIYFDACVWQAKETCELQQMSKLRVMQEIEFALLCKCQPHNLPDKVLLYIP